MVQYTMIPISIIHTSFSIYHIHYNDIYSASEYGHFTQRHIPLNTLKKNVYDKCRQWIAKILTIFLIVIALKIHIKQ